MTPAHLFKSDACHEKYLSIYHRILRRWPVQPDLRTLHTASGLTHYLSIDKSGGPPLIMLHGGHSSSVIWEDMVPYLADYYTIYCLDIMGDYGKSQPASKIQNISQLTKWVYEFLDKIGIGKAFFVGFSYGGWITVNFALCHSEKVERMALLSPAATFVPLKWSFLGRAIWSVIRPTPEVISDFYYYASSQSRHDDLEYRQKLDDLVTLVTAGRKMKGHFVKPSVFSDRQLGSISIPTTVLVGDEEVIYDPQRTLERARAQLQECQIHLVPKASHDIVFSAPITASEKIHDFFSS